MVCQEKIDIKPGMVLAGQQADKTNLWLQRMFQAATSGVDTSPYVAELLGGQGGEDGEGEWVPKNTMKKRTNHWRALEAWVALHSLLWIFNFRAMFKSPIVFVYVRIHMCAPQTANPS